MTSPVESSDYPAFERDAEQRIDATRKGDFRITLRDPDGNPLPGARVMFRLVRHDFRFGANAFLLRTGATASAAGAAVDPFVREYERAFAGMMNYATLPFYWASYEPVEGEERTERLREMAVWCKEHGIRIKGHPLAWHETFPQWARSLTDAAALKLLRSRISRLVGGFRGLVDTWDVFNETTVAQYVDNAVGHWVKESGALECVAEALHLAREANPDAELLYNDFNVSPAFEQLVTDLRQRGAPVDAVGIQSHMHKSVWSVEKLWDVCERYSRLGLPLHFTEATIVSGRLKAPDDNDWHFRHPDWISTPEGEARQLEEGRAFYTTLFSHPAVEAITWWDFADRKAWQGAPAGLVRSDLSPKPLAEWLINMLRERWSTNVETLTDSEGTASFRGFFGEYTLRAVVGERRDLSAMIELPRKGHREATVSLRRC